MPSSPGMRSRNVRRAADTGSSRSDPPSTRVTRERARDRSNDHVPSAAASKARPASRYRGSGARTALRHLCRRAPGRLGDGAARLGQDDAGSELHCAIADRRALVSVRRRRRRSRVLLPSHATARGAGRRREENGPSAVPSARGRVRSRGLRAALLPHPLQPSPGAHVGVRQRAGGRWRRTAAHPPRGLRTITPRQQRHRPLPDRSAPASGPPHSERCHPHGHRRRPPFHARRIRPPRPVQARRRSAHAG